jgi:hypothetical protein
MFFVTYLRGELTCRARQAIIIALGLALGVGLVVTVSAASAGVARAESRVLGALYGVGTDVTVTGAARGVGQSPAEVARPDAATAEPRIVGHARGDERGPPVRGGRPG